MKIHLLLKQLLPALFIMLVCSCESTLKVTTDYDKSISFKQYQTFSIYTAGKINDAISQLNQDRIINAIKSEMVRKGLREATASPDLLVNVVGVFSDKVSVSSSTDYYGYGGVYRPYYWGSGMGVSSSTNYNIQHYKDGSLIIDVVDARTKKLIWQGSGNKEIDGPVKDPDTAIPKAVASILAGFPPDGIKK